MKKTRITAMLLSLCMIFMLTACNTAGNPSTSSPETQESENAQATDDLQGYPNNTVTIICPYTAGGGTDLIARTMADWFGKQWGVSVIVEDKEGGSGAVGMSACATAKADGYTVILTALAAATITPQLNDVGYTDKEFAPIAQVTEMVTALCVNSESGITTIEELIAAGEENYGVMTYGTTGASSFQNVLTQNFMSLIGKEGLFSHVPFDGGAAAITATVGGQTDIVVAQIPDLQSYIDAGNLNCLMVFASERAESLPDVPCATELGYEEIALPTWYGFAAPAGTSEAILNFWDEQVAACLSDPEVVDILTNINQTPVYLDRATFTELWMNTYAMNADVLNGL